MPDGIAHEARRTHFRKLAPVQKNLAVRQILGEHHQQLRRLYDLLGKRHEVIEPRTFRQAESGLVVESQVVARALDGLTRPRLDLLGLKAAGDVKERVPAVEAPHPREVRFAIELPRRRSHEVWLAVSRPRCPGRRMVQPLSAKRRGPGQEESDNTTGQVSLHRRASLLYGRTTAPAS